MKIIIAGYGYVGKAVASALNYQHDIVVVDPKYTQEQIADHPDAEGVIICVPTPYTVNGGCDASILQEVIAQTPIQVPILIKSTVSPQVVDELAKKFDQHWLVYSPEFLRAATASQDFYKQKYIVIGGDDPDCYWQDILQGSLPECRMVFNCTAKEAALIKYASNSFLALKTSYFNQIYDLCQADHMDFDVVRQILTQDPRIGNDHSMVPGVDGLRGWGGHCFPKDTKTFIKYGHSLNTPVTLVESAVEYNEKVRKDLDI